MVRQTKNLAYLKVCMFFFSYHYRNCINQVLPCLVYYPIAFYECTSLSEGCYVDFQTGLLLLRHL